MIKSNANHGNQGYNKKDFNQSKGASVKGRSFACLPDRQGSPLARGMATGKYCIKPRVKPVASDAVDRGKFRKTFSGRKHSFNPLPVYNSQYKESAKAGYRAILPSRKGRESVHRYYSIFPHCETSYRNGNPRSYGRA